MEKTQEKFERFALLIEVKSGRTSRGTSICYKMFGDSRYTPEKGLA